MLRRDSNSEANKTSSIKSLSQDNTVLRISKEDMMRIWSQKNTTDEKSNDFNGFAKDYVEKKFFNAGEKKAENRIKQLHRDFTRTFKCQGKTLSEHLDNKTITEESMENKFKELFGDKYENFKASHNQGNGSEITNLIESIFITHPPKSFYFDFKGSDNVNFYEENGQIYCKYEVKYRLKDFDNNILGELGPAETLHVMKQNEKGQWGYELVHIDSSDPLLTNILLGKDVKPDELKKQLFERETKKNIADLCNDTLKKYNPSKKWDQTTAIGRQDAISNLKQMSENLKMGTISSLEFKLEIDKKIENFIAEKNAKKTTLGRKLNPFTERDFNNLDKSHEYGFLLKQLQKEVSKLEEVKGSAPLKILASQNDVKVTERKPGKSP